jgi:hypothetical protein
MPFCLMAIQRMIGEISQKEYPRKKYEYRVKLLLMSIINIRQTEMLKFSEN